MAEKQENKEQEIKSEEDVQNKIETETDSEQEITETDATESVVDEVDDDTLQTQINELQQEVKQLVSEKDDYYKQLQRLKADFANYRKRSLKEKLGINLQAKIEILEEILPVVDNFERALKSTDNDGEFKKGIDLIYRQLVNVLKQEGLEIIPTEGEMFDHKYHEAIMQIADTNQDSGLIVEELQKGYIFNDKVIRPAMVKVAE